MSNTGLSLFSASPIEDMIKRAEIIVKSKLAPKGFDTPEAVIVACTFGAELGFSPTQSLNLLSVTNGKPTLSYNGYMALCVKHGGRIDEVKSDDKEASVEVWREGREKPVVGTYTLQQAMKAGLLAKDTWQKYPKQMLFARAAVEAIRRAFPDVISGLYSEEEMESVGNAPVKVVTVPTEAKKATVVKAEVAPVAKASTLIEIPDAEVVTEAPKVKFDANNEEHLKLLSEAYAKHFTEPTDEQVAKLKLWVAGQDLKLDELDETFRIRKEKADAKQN